mgnify:CR=1 FL=1
MELSDCVNDYRKEKVLKNKEIKLELQKKQLK